MSILDVLDDPDFAAADYTVTRTPVGSYGVDGLHDPGTPTTFTMRASIQPQRGQVLKVGPEGQTGENVRVAYGDTKLRSAPIPDYFTYDDGTGSATWKVFDAQPWDAFGESGCVSYIAKQGVPG